MPNYVDNNLEIHCSDEETMKKIKELIFAINADDELIYTMEKLLPMPKEFSEQPGYHNFGHKWCCLFWGTKWDVCDPSYKESGTTLTLYYRTAWGPNYHWVEALCRYINSMLNHIEHSQTPKLQITHNYYELGMDFGGILEWTPGGPFKYQEYSLIEYAYLYDMKFHNCLVEKMGYEPFDYELNRHDKLIDEYLS